MSKFVIAVPKNRNRYDRPTKPDEWQVLGYETGDFYWTDEFFRAKEFKTLKDAEEFIDLQSRMDKHFDRMISQEMWEIIPKKEIGK